MIGIDIVEIDRLKTMDHFEGFLKKILSAEEIEYVMEGGNSPRVYERAAGIWAAKEAVAKALGSGFSGLSPRSVRILHDKNGRPSAVAADRSFEISISHEKNYAVAVAFAPGANGGV